MKKLSRGTDDGRAHGKQEEQNATGIQSKPKKKERPSIKEDVSHKRGRSSEALPIEIGNNKAMDGEVSGRKRAKRETGKKKIKGSVTPKNDATWEAKKTTPPAEQIEDSPNTSLSTGQWTALDGHNESPDSIENDNKRHTMNLNSTPSQDANNNNNINNTNNNNSRRHTMNTNTHRTSSTSENSSGSGRQSSGSHDEPSPSSASPPRSSHATGKTTSAASRGAADALYRLMHALPRSDQLRIQRCRLDYALCERAATYFKEDFTAHPVRQLTLQLGCRTDAPWDPTAAQKGGWKPTHDGFQLLFPLIFHHAFHLKELDLSRNDLCAADIVTLCNGLGLKMPSRTGADGRTVPTPPLRLLNLSYNSRIGNAGVLELFSAIAPNPRVKAVILRCVGVDDEGAVPLARLLRERPFPAAAEGDEYNRESEKHADSFLVNLNENRIGAAGTAALGRGLPSYVSVTLCKQMVRRAADM